jgi:hypothetical protein
MPSAPERMMTLFGAEAELVIVDASFEPGSGFALAPLREKLVKGLQDDHGVLFKGIDGRTLTIGPLEAAADDVLPVNLPAIEAALREHAHPQIGEMTIFGWSRGDVTWIDFLPRTLSMRSGLQHYNPQGRVIGLAPALKNDDRGALIAAFALAQSALAHEDEPSRDDITHLVATRARLKTVLQNPQFATDPELWRAFGTISMAIDELERRCDPDFSDAAYLHDAWNAYETALGACEGKASCTRDRMAQIDNDLGTVHVALGDLEKRKTRAGETSRYVNAIDAFQKAQNGWSHGHPPDAGPAALAANNLGVAQLKLGRLMRDERQVQASLDNFQSALTVWQHLDDRERHHCAWAMTEKNRAAVCAAETACRTEALAAARTAAKAGHCL